jgi:hypothetical protein
MVWTVTFIVTGGLILLGACSKGLGLLAFIAAFLLGGVIASGVSYTTSRPNRGDQSFLARIQHDLAAAAREDEEPMPKREYGQLEAQPFDGPNGTFEPGDRLHLYVPPLNDPPIRRDLTGRYVGTQLVDGRRHIVLEMVATERGSYQTTIPIEDADKLTKLPAED